MAAAMRACKWRKPLLNVATRTSTTFRATMGKEISTWAWWWAKGVVLQTARPIRIPCPRWATNTKCSIANNHLCTTQWCSPSFTLTNSHRTLTMACAPHRWCRGKTTHTRITVIWVTWATIKLALSSRKALTHLINREWASKALRSRFLCSSSSHRWPRPIYWITMTVDLVPNLSSRWCNQTIVTPTTNIISRVVTRRTSLSSKTFSCHLVGPVPWNSINLIRPR